MEKRSWACGPTKLVKKRLCPVTTFHVAIALSFVIPSAAEGSAVPRTFLGNVFRSRPHNGRYFAVAVTTFEKAHV
jgi:hypothetical protein